MVNFLLSRTGQVVFSVLFLLVILFVVKQINKNKELNVKILVVTSMLIATGTVASMVTFFTMPNGGTITLCSMMFLSLIGYFYGAKVGFLAGIVYGVVQMMLGTSWLNMTQVLLDYFLAFGCLGLACGLLKNKKYGLQGGYVLGALLRCLVSTISGFAFYLYNADDIVGSFIASGVYNVTYIFPEMVITLIILCIPPFGKVLENLKKSEKIYS